MAHTLGFTPVDVGQIGKALSGFFGTHDGKEAFTRAAASNVIVAGVTLASLDRALELVEMLSVAHPARFFVPVVDREIAKIQAAVSTACVRVSGQSSVCSEIVKLLVPETQHIAMPSIVRANSLPGLANEVIVIGWEPSTERLVRECDLAMFDSQELPESVLLELFGVLNRNHVPTLDFNWVRLGMWREEMKRIFDRPSFEGHAAQLSSIVIKSAPGSSDAAFDAGAYLLAGWFADRLRVEPVAIGRLGWECRGRYRSPISIRVERVKRDTAVGVVSAELWEANGASGERRIVSCERNGVLASTVEGVGSENVTMRRTVERDDLRSVIDRYFLVGESTFNYEAAQRLAWEMYRLTRGFDR
jgi:glucose-6-phosphate dehydrogenase assembly protein OpcA